MEEKKRIIMFKKGHFVVSVVFSIVFYLILDNYHFLPNFIYTIPLFACAGLPDIFEPATSPQHRQFFHSKKVLKFLFSYVTPYSLLAGAFIDVKYYLIFFGAVGYELHLLADFVTPKGLP
jgi:membrane-bound metal-dependent hydrolase YbcI (DUF457 family)